MTEVILSPIPIDIYQKAKPMLADAIALVKKDEARTNLAFTPRNKKVKK